ncbi:hypothetical protein CRM22_006943 [Opisthorchis felineus]|uniref:Mitotic spindle assembly checkpoint protein MAD2A n=1 Tax=Opisthorchis felineus TaxID=147828 RepID=A0A4S2LIS3_OPIFE|nr:hypothetical protein CRM22_006943 [Opisthorchis felineus]
MSVSSTTAGAISLKGSADILVDYFFYAINSILYQRGIYPEASFKKNTKYELSILVAADQALNKYLTAVLEQLRSWLLMGVVQRLVLVIKCVKTEEVLERWQFNVITEDQDESKSPEKKSLASIQAEICHVIRQIVASNTFLPVLDTSCTFELLIYTNKNAQIPDDWDTTGPQFVANSAEIKLRSFSTTVHRVDHLVSYKLTC